MASLVKDSRARSRDWRIAAALGLIAVSIYAPLIGWGLPYATAPDRTLSFAVDEISPVDSLKEARQMVGSAPMWSYNTWYPFLQYFVDASAQAPYAAYLYATGQMNYLTGGMSATVHGHPLGLNDPVRGLRIFTIVERCVTLLMAAFTVMAAFFFSRNLFGRMEGIVAAVLTMLNYLMVYYSRTGNVDVPAFCWTAIGMALFAQILDAGLTVRRAAWLGAVAGLAMATKDQALVFFLPIGLALLFPQFQGWADSYPVKPLLAGLGASLVTYATGTGMLIHPSRNIAHWIIILGKRPNGAGLDALGAVALFWPTHPRTLAGIVALAGDYGVALLNTISVPVVIAACIGVWLVARSSPRRLVVLLPVVALFPILFIPLRYVLWRYCLPLTLPIDAFAAYAFVRLRKATARPLWIAAMVVLCGYRFLIAVDLSYSQYHETRDGAAQWLDAHVRPGDRLGYFGSVRSLPHLRAGIVTTELVPPELTPLAFHGDPKNGSRLTSAVIRKLTLEKPEYIAVIPDWTSTPDMERSANCPAELFDYLVEGKGEYSLAAYFPARALLSGVLKRPRLDYPSVSPPVRIFARKDLSSSHFGAAE